MSLYFSSDSHYGHANIIDYCVQSRGQFRKWPILDVPAMNEALIAAWNSVVGPEDDAVHLGDFALKLKSQPPDNIVKRLNGHKLLVLGNHDLLRVKGRHSKVDLPATVKFWRAMGFEDVTPATYMAVDGQNVYLRHEPTPYSEWGKEAGLQLCGHVHGAWGSVTAGAGRIINVGVDVCPGLKPMSFADLLKRDDGKTLQRFGD